MTSPRHKKQGRLAEDDDEWRALEPITLHPEPKREHSWAGWMLLIFSLLAVSSAATVFDILGRCDNGAPSHAINNHSSAQVCTDGKQLVPPFTLAAWRLQLTSVLLLPGFIVQWRGMQQEERTRFLHMARWLLASGSCLALHFGSWVWSLQHTSLPHSLLMVSATPILLALLALVMRETVSRPEAVGTAVAFVGSVLLALGSARSSQDQSTLVGDLAALLASVAFVGYITVGRKLRSWMPIFVYATPVTATGAMLLSLVAPLVEDVGLAGTGAHGLFGYLTKASYFSWVLYLAVGPGIVGHTGINALLRWMSPLVISLVLQMEPLIGSLLGWLAGQVQASELGPLTWAGGAIVLAGTLVVTWGHTLRQQREDDRKATSVALTQVFGDHGGGAMFEDEEAGLLDEETPRSGAKPRLGG